jgi:hypothetical protein
MHEPSSRPSARREHNVVGRKGVSVEGQVQGFKVSGPKFQSFEVSESQAREALAGDSGILKTLKL